MGVALRVAVRRTSSSAGSAAAIAAVGTACRGAVLPLSQVKLLLAFGFGWEIIVGLFAVQRS